MANEETNIADTQYLLRPERHRNESQAEYRERQRLNERATKRYRREGVRKSDERA